MDGYKEHFYRSRGGKPSMDIGDLSERLELRTRLQCRDFGWYLKNISPDLRVPDSKAIAFGAVSNGNCLFFIFFFILVSFCFVNLKALQNQPQSMFFTSVYGLDGSWRRKLLQRVCIWNCLCGCV
jgi:hypothetical protein